MKDIIFPITYKTDTKGLRDAESGLDKLGGFAKTAGIAIAAGLAVGATAAVAFGTEILKAAAESETVTRNLENAAKNAGIFGDSSLSITKATEALDKHSKKLGELTGIDDELINQLKTGWLAVPDLAAKGTDGINKLAEAAADIAKGTGKDISAVAMAFTKISGDSETALSKLNRIGIVLSDQQKETYQNILDTNGEIAAQDYLLQTLGEKYAGAAAAAANPFERLDVIFGNLKETVGMALLPAFEAVVPYLQTFIEQLVASPEFNTFLSDMTTNFQGMLEYLPTALENLQSFGKDALPAIDAFFPLLNDALYLLAGAFGVIEDSDPSTNTRTFADSMNELADAMTAVGDAFRWVGDTLEWINTTYDKLPGWMKFIVSSGSTGGFSEIGKFYDAVQSGNIGTIRRYLGVPNLSGVPDAPTIPVGRGVRQATGGITTNGGLSWVGERGPELLNLPTGAQVIPLSKIPSGGSSNTFVINVTAGMGTDGAALGEQIVTAIRKYERTSGRVFAAA